VGDAVTQGLELEARLRLTEVWVEAPPIDLRANLSFFRSRVAGVPAPDNRLDQQPSWTANLGADYRLRTAPLTFGGNVNFNPAYTTRISDAQTAFQGRKTTVDAYALWTINPGLRVRLSAGNLAPRDYVTASTIDTDALRETARTTLQTDVYWALRLELKL
jgi:iron complex outermembrane receptor protein